MLFLDFSHKNECNCQITDKLSVLLNYASMWQQVECRFIPKLVCDMIITYRQMHCTDKYSQHSSIIWPVWLNDWVFVYELSGCGFESRFCQIDFTYFSGIFISNFEQNFQILSTSWLNQYRNVPGSNLLGLWFSEVVWKFQIVSKSSCLTSSNASFQAV